MAAPTFTPISLYHSSTPAAVPTNTDLIDGELALNIYDGKLYYKDNTNTVQLLASKDFSSNVTSVSLVSANGFSGTVANPNTTPAITLTTTASGIIKGSSGAIIAASPGVDFAVPPSGSSILYGDGSGGFSNVTVGSGLTFSGGTLASTAGGGSVTSVSVVSTNGFSGTVANPSSTPAISLSTSVSGLIKGSGGSLVAASSGTDYAPATSGSSILYGNGSGGFSNVSVGSGLSFSGGTLSATGGSGTVTSVTLSTGTTGLTVGGGTSQTITSSGTFSVAGTLAVANGGTGSTTLDGAGIVTKTGTQTLSGAKTFSSKIVVSTYASEFQGGTGGASNNLAVYMFGQREGQLGLYYAAAGTNGWRIGEESSGGAFVVYANSNSTGGSFIGYTSTTWSARSDKRIKKDLVVIPNALEKLDKINGYTGKFIDDTENISRSFLIAQEIQEVLPEAVCDAPRRDTDGDEIPENLLGLSYTEVIPLLVQAIKELKAEVSALKAAK